MKYVKRGTVVKAVPDSLEGSFIAAGWKPAGKEDFDATTRQAPNKPSTPPVPPRRDNTTD